MNNYESVFILNPVLSADQAKNIVQKFVKLLSDNSSTIINVENWGLKKMAYPIQKKSSGFYILVEFQTSPETIAILETEFRRDETVMRFLTISLNKFAVIYNERRRRGEFKKTKKSVNKVEKEGVAV